MAIDLDQGKKPNLLDITNQAAVEASTEAAAFAAERYGLSLAASTIRRLMQAKPGRLAGVSDVD